MISPKNSQIIDDQIIIAALGGRKLSQQQLRAVRQIVTSYSRLIASTLALPPNKDDIAVFIEIIRSGLVNTLLIMEKYVGPNQSQESSSVITGQS